MGFILRIIVYTLALLVATVLVACGADTWREGGAGGGSSASPSASVAPAGLRASYLSARQREGGPAYRFEQTASIGIRENRVDVRQRLVEVVVQLAALGQGDLAHEQASFGIQPSLGLKLQRFIRGSLRLHGVAEADEGLAAREQALRFGGCERRFGLEVFIGGGPGASAEVPLRSADIAAERRSSGVNRGA